VAASLPTFTLPQMKQMGRIFGQGIGGGGIGGNPTTINVPPAQSESKRTELARVLAVRHVYNQLRFNQVWLVTDHDLGGRPAAFSMTHAMETMKEIVRDLHAQFAPPTTDVFLHNAVLLLWDSGEKGLFLENFLLDKGKIVDWPSFQRAFFNMRRAYGKLCGEVLRMALGDFLFSLQEIAVGYEHMSIKTLLYLAETRLGRLRKLSRPEEITSALKISDAELGVVLQRELFSRSEVKPPPEQTVGSKRVAEPMVGTEGGPARQKLKMASRTPPSLAGGQPCWNWILRRRGCEGTICMGKTKKGAATPRPHVFDSADKGSAERAYRAWVKQHCAAQD